MDKTRLNLDDPQHKLLAGILTMFVDRFGYTPQELFALLENTQSELYFSLVEISEKNGKIIQKIGN